MAINTSTKVIGCTPTTSDVDGGMIVMSRTFKGPRAKSHSKTWLGSVDGASLANLGLKLNLFPSSRDADEEGVSWGLWGEREVDYLLGGLAGSFGFTIPASKYFSATDSKSFSVSGSVGRFTISSFPADSVDFSRFGSFDFLETDFADFSKISANLSAYALEFFWADSSWFSSVGSVS